MEKYSITEQQLFNLIEGKCSTDESRKIKDSISSSPELKAKYQELLYMHQTMTRNNIVKTPNGFLDRVMSGLESKKFIVEDLFNSINKLGLKFIAMMAILMIVSIYFVANDAIALNFSGLIENATIVKDYNLDVIPVDSFLNDKIILNGLLFSGLIVMLLLFDKAVLKPFFSKRNASFE